MDISFYTIIGIIISAFVGAVIGALIGSTRNQAGNGLILGMLLGPIGWIITLCLPNLCFQCPHCKGSLPDESVTRCRHCGAELKAAKISMEEYKEREEKIMQAQIQPQIQAQAKELGLPPLPTQPQDPRISKEYFVIVDNETKGPFGFFELLDMWRRKEVDAKVLCATPGDDKWQTLKDLRG